MAGNIYHSWNGTVLTITSDSGTSSAELRGEDGCRGAQGIPGGTLYSVSQAATNLLDNTYFLNPINQRGQTTYTGRWNYSIDRWMTATADATEVVVAIEQGGITFTTNNNRSIFLLQRIAKGILDDTKSYTIAAYLADGTIQISGNYLDKSSSNYDVVNIVVASGTKIKYVVMYEGTYTADTLPAYQYKGYAAELLECQRYYIKIATQPINGWCYNWGRVAAFVSLPVKMRVPYPTVVLAQETPNFYVNATAYNAALEGSTSVENGVVIYYTHTAAINGQCVIPEFAAEINADL